ncbi:unnamed protein product [Rotaria magnacalcarata]|uniref:Uncharacterized protein n=1 Tax=Rotaria magnacalcarata TaxID=392030 RepID=A0A815PGQ0_9BILA|nr:unnamed protein product [Rotaria magnacalcarata]
MIAQSFVAGASGSECVIFQIDIPDSYYENINGGLKYNRPFFRLESLSQFQSESEIIFSMGTLFYIESVEQYDVWYVCLKLEGETEEVSKMLWMSEATENVKYNWQNRNSVDDRILLLTEKLPQSCRTIVNIYIKYGFFADEDSVIVAESLTTYHKGFEILSKCLPDHHYLFVIAKYLSIGILHNNKHDYSLAVHCGETALHLAQTYLHDDSDYLLISYNYLAVVHQFGDHYAEALHPTSLKAHLSVLLKQIYTEYNNLRMFETSLRNLQRSIKTFLKIKPACFAKIYHNAQILQNLRSFVDVYQRSLYLIQQAYFSKCHTERCKMRRAGLSIESISNDIGAVVHNFVYSSHATLCQDRVRQKPRPPHRSVWIYRYRFCGCFKDSIASHNRTTGRWPKFSTI